MSDENLIIPIKDKSKISKNNQSTKVYYNQIINNIDLNNIISNSSISNNSNFDFTNKENDSLNNISFSNYSFDLKQIDKTHINYTLILLYKELISLLKNFNNNIYDYSIYKEFNNYLNIIANTNTTKESLINIFKKTFIKIINLKTKELKENISQYKSYILLLEQNNRYHIKQNFLKQTKIDILENEIDLYMEVEEEFNEMKEKFKYENGKFLHNEKKENEILILRAENSNLKKVIDKNEKTIEEKELMIESMKKKSSSMINTNKNTLRNSFELNENNLKENSSLIIMHNKYKIKQKQKLSHNNSTITNFKKINSPINNDYKTNNNDINKNYNTNKSFHTKKISYGENMSNKISSKDLINKKLKNKVLNIKKIRRTNDNPLDNYNKSSVHISNSMLSNHSNNSNRKKIKKTINSFFKNNNSKMGINCIHKKINSGSINYNSNNESKFNNNAIKNNSNKIIVKNILDNYNNDGNKSNKINNNKGFLLKTSDKKFYMINKKKNKTKTNLKNKKDDLIKERNNYSLLKSPSTFSCNNIENSEGIKNSIVVNNFIQNSSDVPISDSRKQNKSKEKMNVSEFIKEENLTDRINNKYGFLYVNIKNSKIKSKV